MSVSNRLALHLHLLKLLLCKLLLGLLHRESIICRVTGRLESALVLIVLVVEDGCYGLSRCSFFALLLW